MNTTTQPVRGITPYILATLLTIGVTALFGVPLAIATHYNSDFQYDFLFLAPFIWSGYIVAVINIIVFSKRLYQKTVARNIGWIFIIVSMLYLTLIPLSIF
jgi:hypothetical protein